MRKLTFATTLAFTFLLGCMSAPFIVPPARADQTNIQRWEYSCRYIRVGGADAAANVLTGAFNEMGAEGWEFIGSGSALGGSGGTSCFKRPL